MKKCGRTEVLSARVDPALRQALIEIAHSNYRSLSGETALALRQYVESQTTAGRPPSGQRAEVIDA